MFLLPGLIGLISFKFLGKLSFLYVGIYISIFDIIFLSILLFPLDLSIMQA